MKDDEVKNAAIEFSSKFEKKLSEYYTLRNELFSLGNELTEKQKLVFMEHALENSNIFNLIYGINPRPYFN